MQQKKHILGRSLVPAEKVFKQSEPIYIPLFLADPTKKRQILWEIEFEHGGRDAGKVKRNAINLPKGMPVGTHKLTVIIGNALLSKGYKIVSSKLIVE